MIGLVSAADSLTLTDSLTLVEKRLSEFSLKNPSIRERN